MITIILTVSILLAGYFFGHYFNNNDNNNNTNSSKIIGICYVPYVFLKTLGIIKSLTLHKILLTKYYYIPHFAEKTEAQCG